MYFLAFNMQTWPKEHFDTKHLCIILLLFLHSDLETTAARASAARGRTASTAWRPAASRPRRWAVRRWWICYSVICAAKSLGTCHFVVTSRRCTCSIYSSRAPASSKFRLWLRMSTSHRVVAGKEPWRFALCSTFNQSSFVCFYAIVFIYFICVCAVQTAIWFWNA